MLPEALSKYIDELLEGKDPTISSILREHPVERDEFVSLVCSALLTYGALNAIEVPEGAEALSRERGIKFMEEQGGTRPSIEDLPEEEQQGLLNRIRDLLQEKFRRDR